MDFKYILGAFQKDTKYNLPALGGLVPHQWPKDQLFPYFFVSMRIQAFSWGLKIMKIPIEMLKEIRESGYDKKLVYNYIRELLDSDKEIKENNNLELLDNYLLDKDPQEVSKNAPEILMAAELLDNYLLDKRFVRELEDEEYDAA